MFEKAQLAFVMHSKLKTRTKCIQTHNSRQIRQKNIQLLQLLRISTSTILNEL